MQIQQKMLVGMRIRRENLAERKGPFAGSKIIELALLGPPPFCGMSVAADWCGNARAGDSFSKQFRTILIWAKEDGRWQITNEHDPNPRTTTLIGGEFV